MKQNYYDQVYFGTSYMQNLCHALTSGNTKILPEMYLIRSENFERTKLKATRRVTRILRDWPQNPSDPNFWKP